MEGVLRLDFFRVLPPRLILAKFLFLPVYGPRRSRGSQTRGAGHIINLTSSVEEMFAGFLTLDCTSFSEISDDKSTG